MIAADTGVRGAAVLRNVNRVSAHITEHDLAREPWRHYLDFEPARGDYGIVAHLAGQPVGVVWVVFARALGFIQVDVPELVISVDESRQGQGIGAMLLEVIRNYGREARWPGISLSVEAENPAKRLYERVGFETVAAAAEGTMFLAFAEGSNAAQISSSDSSLSATPEIRSVAVYCGSRSGFGTGYQAAAEALGSALAKRGIRLVYGGGNIGLMGSVANASLADGGEVVGVIPQSLVDREMAHHGLSSLEVVETMAQRKTRMENLSDAFVVLPGGAGTLEETFEVLTMMQLGELSGPLALVNTNGFWDPLLQMLEKMAAEGFLRRKFIDSLIVVETPAELFEGFRNWRAPGDKWA
ncbi:LOG family protein ORF6 in fasciation locus [Corynebacterium occultum]|uniref:LOG family protein ORF6 in fasciation locus n=2 Tax=Corynebacterium occultum TaxID=2675219 RepID=A0A6B8VXS1_9CORY|nr:LOG family protein ORF6 in fasciation locus [Corynebacterium occultum]